MSTTNSPAPADIRAAREAAGLTQTAAGELVSTTCRVWQQWEAGDRHMHPAFWTLFRAQVMLRALGVQASLDGMSDDQMRSAILEIGRRADRAGCRRRSSRD